MQKDQVRRGHPQLREVRPHRPHLISGSPCGWRCAAPGILVVMNTLAWCGSSGELRCDGALVIVVECQGWPSDVATARQGATPTSGSLPQQVPRLTHTASPRQKRSLSSKGARGAWMRHRAA